MHVYMDMAAAEDGTWDATAYRSGSRCLTPHYSGEDPIPAQGSLAPDYVSWVETRIILGYGLRAGVNSCMSYRG